MTQTIGEAKGRRVDRRYGYYKAPRFQNVDGVLASRSYPQSLQNDRNTSTRDVRRRVLHRQMSHLCCFRPIVDES